jgi:ATP adenylyltransferase
LATKLFKEQTDPLEENDLEMTYACLKAWEEPKGEKLFAFFNSGDHSGASQPHRHVQFLPVESIWQGVDHHEWDLLMQTLADSNGNSGKFGFMLLRNRLESFLTIAISLPLFNSAPSLPFTYFLKSIPEHPSPSKLYETYSELYESTFRAYSLFAEKLPKRSKEERQDSSKGFSYNMGMTTSAMIMCPRVAEGKLLLKQDGSEVGFVALNGTVLAGGLMVKGNQEWNYLRETPLALEEVLTSIGVPSSTSSMKI